MLEPAAADKSAGQSRACVLHPGDLQLQVSGLISVRGLETFPLSGG